MKATKIIASGLLCLCVAGAAVAQQKGMSGMSGMEGKKK